MTLASLPEPRSPLPFGRSHFHGETPSWSGPVPREQLECRAGAADGNAGCRQDSDLPYLSLWDQGNEWFWGHVGCVAEQQVILKGKKK